MCEMFSQNSITNKVFPVKTLLQIAVRQLATSPDMYTELIKTLPVHLKSQLLLVASKSGKLSDKALKSLVHGNITELDLSECSICDKTLESLSICHNLEKLNLNSSCDELTNISSAALKELFQNIPSIGVLYVRKCTAVNDDVINTLVESCPLLTDLDIGSSSITDLSLKKLKFLEQLISLNVSSTKITDRGIVSLVRGSCAETLCELRLDNCKGITDFAIEIIVLYCANMRVLLFHDCSVTASLTPHETDVATYSRPANKRPS